MRKIQSISIIVSPLLFGLPLFVFMQAALAADNAPVKSQESYQKAAETCITQTEHTLEERGILPSEESSEYDTKFDEAYKSCMASKGLPEEPANGGADEDVPSGALQKLDAK